MKFKEFTELGIKLDEGVLITKYLMNLPMAKYENAKKILNDFTSNGYNIEIVPGEFVKIFTMNDKEIAELSSVLEEINERGLKEIFQANLRPGSFKRGFLERVKFCIVNNFPYLNEDNSFIYELYNPQAFAEYTSHKPVSMIKTAQEVDRVENEKLNLEAEIANMDLEDKEVYDYVINNLSYLILQQPTNEDLVKIVNNIKVKLINTLKSKGYRFLPLTDIIEDVMFEGLEVTPEMESVKDVILNAFPEDMKRKEGRG